MKFIAVDENNPPGFEEKKILVTLIRSRSKQNICIGYLDYINSEGLHWKTEDGCKLDQVEVTDYADFPKFPKIRAEKRKPFKK